MRGIAIGVAFLFGFLSTSARGAEAPDHPKIVYIANLDRQWTWGNYEIYTMDADGGNPVRLTDNSCWDGGANWFVLSR